MRLYYDFLMKMGIDENLANASINAVYQTLVMLLVVSIHKFYLFHKKKQEIPREEQSYENIGRLIDECFREKEFLVLFVIFYLVLSVANYIFIIK